MNYLDWLQEQTPERQALSEKLMNASYNLGKANREGDDKIAEKYRAEIVELYRQIGEMDADC